MLIKFLKLPISLDTIMPKSSTERSQALRARRREAGLVEVIITATKEYPGLRTTLTQAQAERLKKHIRQMRLEK